MNRSILLVAALAACTTPTTTMPEPEQPVAEPETVATPAPPPAPDPATDDVTRITAIELEIQADPDNTEVILAKHGMTKVEFDAEVSRIKSDPVLSIRYEEESSKN